jgi:hypothetical protein
MVFGETVSVNFEAAFEATVAVTEDEATFVEEGEFLFNEITVNDPALVPRFLEENSFINFFVLEA